MQFCLIFIVLVLTSFSAIAKNDCQPHYDRLDHIRSIMRRGYKEPYGEKLRESERQIKEQIRLCKKNINKEVGYYSSNISTPTPRKKYTSDIRFSTQNTDQLGNQKLVVKGMFQGQKQQDWLNYYKPTKACRSPKKISQFSKCLSTRDDIAVEFSKKWDKENSSINNTQLGNSQPPKVNKRNNSQPQKSVSKNMARAANLNIATCNFWKLKLQQKPTDRDIKQLMETECKKVR